MLCLLPDLCLEERLLAICMIASVNTSLDISFRFVLNTGQYLQEPDISMN